MQYPVTDRAAVEFARSFYESLADGLPVDASVAEARKAVSFAIADTAEWGTPVLFMRTSDGRVFDVGHAMQAPRPAPAPASTPAEPPVSPAPREAAPRASEVVLPTLQEPAQQVTAQPMPVTVVQPAPATAPTVFAAGGTAGLAMAGRGWTGGPGGDRGSCSHHDQGWWREAHSYPCRIRYSCRAARSCGIRTHEHRAGAECYAIAEGHVEAARSRHHLGADAHAATHRDADQSRPLLGANLTPMPTVAQAVRWALARPWSPKGTV